MGCRRKQRTGRFSGLSFSHFHYCVDPSSAEILQSWCAWDYSTCEYEVKTMSQNKCKLSPMRPAEHPAHSVLQIPPSSRPCWKHSSGAHAKLHSKSAGMFRVKQQQHQCCQLGLCSRSSRLRYCNSTPPETKWYNAQEKQQPSPIS